MTVNGFPLSSTTYRALASRLAPAIAGPSQVPYRPIGPPLPCSKVSTHVQRVHFLNTRTTKLAQGVIVARRFDAISHMSSRYLYDHCPPLSLAQKPHAMWLEVSNDKLYSCSIQDEHEDLATFDSRGGIRCMRQIREILATTSLSLHYLHRAGFVHRDVQASNIMKNLENDGPFLLGDIWGAVIEDKELGNPPVGLSPLDYPPELAGEAIALLKASGEVEFAEVLRKKWLLHKRKDSAHPFAKTPVAPKKLSPLKLSRKHLSWSKSGDVYALGQVIWNLMHANRLWNPKRFPITCRLVRKMLHPNPKSRPTAKAVHLTMAAVQRTVINKVNKRFLRRPTRPTTEFSQWQARDRFFRMNVDALRKLLY
ncbi:MAG: hypothetical protein SP1CHLAM54_04560 [Chlamydiia bacterium]|nr:hypothetical protein [Chlamydiia bacterium]MCH9615368.1 hypothetical protein [Chlamydiia bacterium]MCH9628310.1 hypothetical protein [Chlamydiia bacterium]